ncbi:efflux RND transporter periplasmic adaptor subunit [Hymenobacter sp. H14-R3]|uniref:efflux RND transporter periplasmic adaptor subunit n=1 Tax=Hymenobacter sp. H14-R3 TaxID=3046308 RepID=UPI0024BBD192|nr:biotin/lipoyl-binding protein [Hymenobacter sp. H14-R3]MDJ0367480.1 efflux RND transporter periplasmic adaptor subunit [Hymenobacter sp. H14-R3]
MRFIFILPAVLLVACSAKESTTSAAGPAPVQPATVREVVALGRIEPEHKLTSLAAQASGVVEALPVAEGQEVKKGELLLTLNHAVEQAQVTQARSQLGTQQAQIAADAAALRSAQAQARNLARTAQRVQELTARGAETAQSRDDAQTQATTQQQEVARLQAAAQSAQAQLATLRAGVAVAEAQLRQRFVYAPGAGRVLKWEAEVGGSVSPGTSLGDFAPAGRPTVLCEVDELFASRVRVGQAAYVRPQGGTEHLASGTVLFAAPYLKQKSLFAATAGAAEDRRVREVRVVLPVGGDKLLLNSRVECVIDLQ